MTTKIFNDYDLENGEGLDPLQDLGLNSAMSVLSFSLHTIEKSEAGRPDLISYHMYGSTAYWREIMSYNGITDVRGMVNGSVIKIPDRAQLLSAFNRRVYPTNNKTVAV